jgi:heptosyltransferase-3
VALLLKHSRLYIGVDTLISHMAAAAGTPTVVLFGPVNPVTWGPWPKGFRDGDSPWEALGNEPKGNVTIVQGDPDVVARDQAVARWSRGSSSESMETLTAARVIEAAERALDG